MKKTILLYLLFSAFLLPYARGQEEEHPYVPMPLESAEWRVFRGHRNFIETQINGELVYFPGTEFYSGEEVRFKGHSKVFLNGKWYYVVKVYKNGLEFGYHHLRQDTVERKVYRYMGGFIPPERLMYDFSANVGDTIKNSSANMWYVVDSITYSPVFGIVRKHLHLRSIRQMISYYYTYELWIEGIGSAYGLFEQRKSFSVSESDAELLCVKDVANVLYVSSLIQSCEDNLEPLKRSEVISMENNTLKVFPNPSTQPQILIANPATALNFSLVNMYGQKLFEHQDKSMMEEFIAKTAPGIYFLNLVTTKNQYFVTKFIKD